jgi:hypothetical protein
LVWPHRRLGEGSDVKRAIYIFVAFTVLAGMQMAINHRKPGVLDETPADRDAICAIASPVLHELADDNEMRYKIQCNVRFFGPGKALADGQGGRPLVKGVRVALAKSFGSWFVVSSLSCKLAECAPVEGLPPDWNLQ